MTLRVTIEIVPWGDEGRKRTIRQFDISNMSAFGSHSQVDDYKVKVDLEDAFIIKDHDRRDGAEVLVARVLDTYNYYNRQENNNDGARIPSTD